MESLRYIAYADDVALTASTPVGLQASLDVLIIKAAGVGLELDIPKCPTLYIRGDGKEKMAGGHKAIFSIREVRIKSLGSGELASTSA